jgi:hypothetical protein
MGRTTSWTERKTEAVSHYDGDSNVSFFLFATSRPESVIWNPSPRDYLTDLGVIAGLVVVMLICDWLESEDQLKAIKEEDEAAFQAWRRSKELKEERAQEEFEARYKKMMLAKDPSLIQPDGSV